MTAFTDLHNKFIVEAYFRSGTRNEQGNWDYSYKSCYEQFLEQFPELEFCYGYFRQYVRRLIQRFRKTGNVHKGKSTGRPTVLTDEVVADIHQRMDASPNKSLRRLSAETNLSFGTCQKASKKHKKR